MNKVIRHLRNAVLLRQCADLTDGQLLEGFLSRREPAGLQTLVERHAPMVWGVCRRILCNDYDAEDAFQATFLVLVRKAAAVSPREMVGNWLYGVAHQTALKARATLARRQQRERQVVEMPEPALPGRDLWDDLQPVLDRELSRLPDKYRVAIVLCDLEGRTRKEAAQQLGVPEGTLAARLARGRVMLAKRLAPHRLAISGGALAAVLSQQVASAAVPASVVSSTIKAVTLFGAGQASAAAVFSAKAIVLTEGVLQTMVLNKIKVTATTLLLLAALGSAAVGLSRQTQAAGDDRPMPISPGHVQPRESDSERSILPPPPQDVNPPKTVGEGSQTRQWEDIAAFYDRTGHPRAAAFYRRLVAEKDRPQVPPPPQAPDRPTGPPIPPPPPRPGVEPGREVVLTEEEWVARGVEGKSVVELEIAVDQAGQSSAPGRLPDLTLSARGRLLKGRQLYIHVAPPVVEQLRRIGIENPMDFYQGKVVRVRGVVKAVRHADIRAADYDAYYVLVEGLDQFVSLRDPARAPDKPTGAPPPARPGAEPAR
jgi:RNA polymerase sigma factor (sigma-70 family)